MAQPLMPTRLGLVGGLAWPSTVDYYTALCSGVQQAFTAAGHPSPGPTPPMIIDSLDLDHLMRMRGQAGDEASWAGFDALLRDALLRLQASGCDFALIASVTPHARLHAITEGLTLPVLSILDVTAQAVAASGAQNVLTLGTAVTMTACTFDPALNARGLTPLPRLPQTEIYALSDLLNRRFYTGEAVEGRAELLDYIHRNGGAEAGTAVILGCTELILAFPEHATDTAFQAEGLSFVNPVRAHIGAVLDRILPSTLARAG